MEVIVRSQGTRFAQTWLIGAALLPRGQRMLRGRREGVIPAR
jgi:hypothetical protein